MKANWIGNTIVGALAATIVGVFTVAVNTQKDINKAQAKKLEKFNEYMEDKPYTKTLEIEDKCREAAWVVDKQRYLDSIAYRDVLNSHEAINNSAIVADFNKIASNTKASTIYRTSVSTVIRGDEVIDRKSLLNKLINLNITKKDYNIIEKLDNQQLQYALDSIEYRRFFEKHGLLNENIAKKLTEVASKIRP